jgi:TolB-like protein
MVTSKMKMRGASKSFFVLVVLFSLFQCSFQPLWPVYTKDGKEFGTVQGAFRYRWWNYYERGLSYSEGRYFKEALADFKEAIRQRENDQRMARTYGMHFIDYFPHRELGIVCYETGKLEIAKRELKLSLSDFPTAKARFYLDSVRRALIEQEAREVTSPILTLDFRTGETWTRQDPVIFSGEAEDEQYVAAISIMGAPIFLEGSEKHIRFKKPLALSPGRHAIEVEAKNLLGKTTKRRMIIHVDREGPVISVDELQFGQAVTGKEVTICGFLYDEAGVSHFSVNDREISIRPAVEVGFSQKLTLDADKLNLVARDCLGNETCARISLSALSSSHTPVLLACSSPGVVGAFVTTLFSVSDTRPPNIQLNGWADTETVFLEKVYLQGQVRDESKIESLAINGVPILRRKAQRIFFSHLAKLEEGENGITIEARDEAGNVATKTISVIRRVPKALQLGERLSLSILPFEHKGMVSEASLSFQDNLADALVNQNRFRVVERDKLDLILQEQKLSRSKLIDRRNALRLGRLAAAHSVITGSIIETRTGIEIVGRMIDTETSEILATKDVYDEAKDLPALRALAEGMAIRFHREFPLVDGLVVELEGKHIFTDLGQDELRVQKRLIVYREKVPIHGKSGEVLGADNEIIGRARITQVLPEMSKAVLLNGKPWAAKRLDKVITE